MSDATPAKHEVDRAHQAQSRPEKIQFDRLPHVKHRERHEHTESDHLLEDFQLWKRQGRVAKTIARRFAARSLREASKMSLSRSRKQNQLAYFVGGPSNPQNLKFQLRQDGTGLRWVVKNLEKKAKQRGGKASPDKLRQIRERAGELAMNQGKRAHQPGKQEVQRAKRELLDLEITSPQG